MQSSSTHMYIHTHIYTQSTDLLSLVQGVRDIHHEAEPDFGVGRMFNLLQIHTIKFEHLEFFLYRTLRGIIA